MTIGPAPICMTCKHFDRGANHMGLTCKAYPYPDTTIPDEILDGEHDHHKPFPGDHGILYDPITEGKFREIPASEKV